MNNEDMYVRKLSPEETEYRHKMSGGLTRNMGELYRLPGGAITGIGGVNLFHQAIKEQLNKTKNGR